MALNKPIPFPHKQYGMYYVEEDLRDAAYRGDVNRIEKIRDSYPKLNVNAVNEYGETALYIACKRNQNEVILHLLQYSNIDLNASTILGNDCLLVATWNDNTEIAKKLIEHGANVHARTNADRKYHGNVSALDIAKERGNKVLEEYIYQFAPELKSQKISSPRLSR